MSKNELIIRLILDASQAEQRDRAYHQGARQRIKQTADAQAQADKERVKSDDAYIKAVQRNLKAEAKLRADAEASLAAQKRAAISEQEKSDADYIKAVQRNLKAEAQLERQAASEKKQLHADVARVLKEFSREEAAETKRQAAEIATTRKTAIKQELSDMAIAHEFRMTQWDLEQKALREQQAASDMAAVSAKAWIGAFVGIGTVVAGVKGVADYFDTIKRDTIEAAKEVLNFRREVLELAAMKDSLGNSTPETAAQLEFRSKTLQSRPDALRLAQMAEGAGQAAIGVNVSREAFSEGLVAAGQLQSLETSDAGAYGSLVGTLALEAKPGTTGAELGAALNKSYRQQQPAKFSNMAEFAKQRSDISYMVQTGLLTGDQASGLLSGIGMTQPAEASTILRQLMTSTSADFMRARKMKLLPGMENETSAEYFQNYLKLSDQSTPMERLEAAGRDLVAKEAEARAKGQAWNPEDYLMKHGLNNAESRRGYDIVAGLMKQGQWDKVIKPGIDAPMAPTAIQDAFNQRAGREPVLLQRQAEMAREAAAVRRGTGNAEAGLMQVQQAAFEKLKGQGKITGDFDDWKNRGLFGRAIDDNFYFGAHSQVNMEAQASLAKEAERLKIDWHAPISVDARSGLRRTEYAGDEELFRLQQRIQTAGGNPLAGVADDVKAATKALVNAAQALEQQADPQVRPAMPAAPPRVP